MMVFKNNNASNSHNGSSLSCVHLVTKLMLCLKCSTCNRVVLPQCCTEDTSEVMLPRSVLDLLKTFEGNLIFKM